MKVCVVVNNSVWYDPRVKKQIEEYNRAGLDVCVVGLRDKRYDSSEISRLSGQVTIVDISSSYYTGHRSYFKIIKREYLIVKRITKAIVHFKPNVIHANDLNALIPSYYASKRLSCGLVYDSHEIWLENFAPSFAEKTIYGYFERKIVKKVDKFICVSHATADYFANKYGIEKPWVITNCVRKVQPSVRCAQKSSFFEVLNHGLFYKGRGYDLMINAAKSLTEPSIHYVLRGFGSLEETLRAEVSNNNLTNVVFEPPVKVEDLIPLAAHSHVGIAITEPVCLSFKLTVSNKLFEYAAAGLPVIMSDVPEHRYLNDKYRFGIVLKDNSVECLNEAVEQLYKDNALYNELSQNAISFSEKINWENEFEKLISFELSQFGENKRDD